MLSELPTGHVHEATVVTDEGVVAEVLLRIGGQPLLLMAGEAYETWEGGLAFHRLDESVLAFTDPAAEQIPWSSPREGRVRASLEPQPANSTGPLQPEPEVRPNGDAKRAGQGNANAGQR